MATRAAAKLLYVIGDKDIHIDTAARLESCFFSAAGASKNSPIHIDVEVDGVRTVLANDVAVPTMFAMLLAIKEVLRAS